MPVNIHGKQYITVAERLTEARKDIKSINTEVIQNGGAVVIKATVVTTSGTFTGISSANPDKAIEKSSPYEVAETSAVGRALGFAGYGAVESIASADEMARVTTQQEPNGAIKTVVEEPPMPTEEIPVDKKVCSAHDDPIVMYEGKSKTKKNADGTPKSYWWHKGPNGEMCFGQGYMD